MAGLPPGLLLALDGKICELLTKCIVDPVQIAQVPNIAGARAALAGLQPTDLRGGDEQLLGHLIDGPSKLGAQCSEQHTELTAADCGTAGSWQLSSRSSL